MKRKSTYSSFSSNASSCLSSSITRFSHPVPENCIKILVDCGKSSPSVFIKTCLLMLLQTKQTIVNHVCLYWLSYYNWSFVVVCLFPIYSAVNGPRDPILGRVVGNGCGIRLKTSVSMVTKQVAIWVLNKPFPSVLSPKWQFQAVGHPFFTGPSHLNRQNRTIFRDFRAFLVIPVKIKANDVGPDVLRNVQRHDVAQWRCCIQET